MLVSAGRPDDMGRGDETFVAVVAAPVLMSAGRSSAQNLAVMSTLRCLRRPRPDLHGGLDHVMTQSPQPIVVGVLALQGAFSEHLQLLRQAFVAVDGEQATHAWSAIEVRTPAQLDSCDALVIPGGESTTIALVAARSDLLEPLRRFVK